MHYPLSELIDRFSILDLKLKRLPKDPKIAAEHKKFADAIQEFGVPTDEYIEEMIKINGRIWDLEFEIRMTDKLSLEEIGRRTLLIRKINKERIEMKNKIAREHGEFEEVKVDHPSE